MATVNLCSIAQKVLFVNTISVEVWLSGTHKCLRWIDFARFVGRQLLWRSSASCRNAGLTTQQCRRCCLFSSRGAGRLNLVAEASRALGHLVPFELAWRLNRDVVKIAEISDPMWSLGG